MLADSIWHPSPNFGPRRDELTPQLVVLHYTAMTDLDEVLKRLCTPEHEVSCHYLIDDDGRLFTLVDGAMRAWHAGAGMWAGVDDINSRSIGIEMLNSGRERFSEAQMLRLEVVLASLMDRWCIARHGVIGHSDMAPVRKKDPGRFFDWQRLAQKGLSVWPDASLGRGTAEFEQTAAQFGYPVSEVGVDAVFDAFRQRFRPRHVGPFDATDRAMMDDLATRFSARSLSLT
jgi:N-acetylmuramoyl-L-alanine amidase